MGYQRLTSQHGHPLANAKGGLWEHRKALFDSIGPGSHPCHWCQVAVTWMPGMPGGTKGALVVDHLDFNQVNYAPDNLVPSCQPCNLRRSRKRVRDDELSLPSGIHRVRAEERTCLHCGKTFLIAKPLLKHGAKVGKGAGNYCSKACVARAPKPRRIGFDELTLARPNGVLERAIKADCLHCGNSFLVRVAAVRMAEKLGGNAGKFCSLSCSTSYRHSQRS